MPRKIAVIVGSLREAAYSRATARALIALAPESLSLELVEIGDLPLYNQDFEDEEREPAAWGAFRARMKSFEGVLFVTPEYNRSIPAALKNALDVGSRPYGESIWTGLPGAVLSVSPGQMGGFGANHHLRQCLVFLDVPCMQQPEAYLAGVGKVIDERGELLDERTRGFLKKFVDGYADWARRIAESRFARRHAQ